MRKVLNDKKLLIRAGAVVLLILIALMIRMANSRNNNVTIEASSQAENVVETSMFVDISGAVKNPGVYKFDSGTRLYEVIERAGGLTKRADKDGINQAEFVEDGEKIVIPRVAKRNRNGRNGKGANGDNNALINLNTASREELMNITGVGEVIADRIIEYRNSTRFNSIEDIMNVKGIGNATFEKMKSQITV